MIRGTFGLLILTCLLGGFLTAQAGDRVEIKMMIKNNRFVPDEIHVQAGTTVELAITNADSTVEEFDSFPLNREKLIPAGKTVTIFLPNLQRGTYEFMGEFHPKTAQGRLIVE
jgi:plastocyanin